ncbi:MAG: hypothetical protein JST07_05600 [Bacteroidetes bacterium]|nr:hypothetical protein [Bacteroidota bacterium]
MVNLLEIETSVTQLSSDDFIKFREWFLAYEAMVWDEKIANNIQEDKLSSLANKAIAEFNAGKWSKL